MTKFFFKKAVFIFFILLFSHFALAEKPQDKSIDSLKKEIKKLQESNELLKHDNDQFKESFDRFKKDAVDNTIREYQLTNDKVDSLISWVSLIAGIFGSIIAIAGIFIGIQTFRVQAKSEKTLKDIEDARLYADARISELDQLYSKTKADCDVEYQKMVELIKNSILSQMDNEVKEVREAKNKRKEEMDEVDNEIKELKEFSNKKKEEISSFSIQNENDEIVKNIEKRMEFLESLGLAEDPMILLKKAKLFHNEQKHDEVIEILSKVVKKDDKNGEVHWYLAYSFFEKGNYESAIEHYKQSINFKYFLEGSYNNIGVAYQKVENHVEAIKMFDEAIRIKEDEPLYLRNKGKSLDKSGRKSEAIEQYKQSIKVAPTDSESYNLLIDLLITEKRVEDAISTMELGIKNIPDQANYLNFKKGAYLRGIERYEESIKIFNNLIEVGYEVPRSKLNIALIRSKEKRFDEANKIIDTVSEMNPQEESLQRAIMTILKEQGSKAVGEFLLKNKLNIINKSFFITTASDLTSLGEFKMAEQLYLRALEILDMPNKNITEGDIVEKYEILIILTKHKDAELFYEKFVKGLKQKKYIDVAQILVLVLQRFNNKMDDEAFLTQLAQLSIDRPTKWNFIDINNYLKPILKPQFYAKMLEVQAEFAKEPI